MTWILKHLLKRNEALSLNVAKLKGYATWYISLEPVRYIS